MVDVAAIFDEVFGADSLHSDTVKRWSAEIDRLGKLPAVSPDGAEALKRAQAFVSDGWALQAVRLGWGGRDIRGVSSCSLGASRPQGRCLRRCRPGRHG